MQGRRRASTARRRSPSASPARTCARAASTSTCARERPVRAPTTELEFDVPIGRGGRLLRPLRRAHRGDAPGRADHPAVHRRHARGRRTRPRCPRSCGRRRARRTRRSSRRAASSASTSSRTAPTRRTACATAPPALYALQVGDEAAARRAHRRRGRDHRQHRHRARGDRPMNPLAHSRAAGSLAGARADAASTASCSSTCCARCSRTCTCASGRWSVGPARHAPDRRRRAQAAHQGGPHARARPTRRCSSSRPASCSCRRSWPTSALAVLGDRGRSRTSPTGPALHASRCCRSSRSASSMAGWASQQQVVAHRRHARRRRSRSPTRSRCCSRRCRSCMMAGSLNLGDIVNAQPARAVVLPRWFVSMLPAFVLFLIAGARSSSTRRRSTCPRPSPSSSRGFATEYSSMKFGLLFLSEFSNIFIFSALLVTLFFGGWQHPVGPGRRVVRAARPGRLHAQDLHRHLRADVDPRDAAPRPHRPAARARLEGPAPRLARAGS